MHHVSNTDTFIHQPVGKHPATEILLKACLQETHLAGLLDRDRIILFEYLWLRHQDRRKSRIRKRIITQRELMKISVLRNPFRNVKFGLLNFTFNIR